MIYGIGKLKATPVFSAYSKENHEVIMYGVCKFEAASHLVTWSKIMASSVTARIKRYDLLEDETNK